MTETSEPLEFQIYAKQGFVRIELTKVFGYPERTCAFGGYDTRSTLEIKSGGFSVLTNFHVSTGDIYNFFEQLKNCYENLTGTARLDSYEMNLRLAVEFDNLGHAKITGEFIERLEPPNELTFNLTTDQTYLKNTVSKLERIYKYYGNNKGVKGLETGS